MSDQDLRHLEAEIQDTDEAIAANGPELKSEQPEEGSGAGTEQRTDIKPLNDEAQVGGMLKTAVAMAAPMFPSLKEIYTDETIAAVSSVTTQLANKHGWNVGGIMGKYAEEIAFAGVMIPLGIGTYQAVLHDLNERDRQAANDAAQPHQEKPEEQKPEKPGKVHKLEPVTDG